MTDTTPPVLIGSSPSDGATDVAQNASIVLTFDEPVLPGPGNFVLDDITLNSVVLVGTVNTSSYYITVSGNQVFVDPHFSKFNLGDTYSLSFAADSVQDLAGNAFAGSTETFTITTTDVLPPGGPLLGYTSLAAKIDATYTFYFDENVVRGSGDFQIHKSSDGSLVSDININDATQVSFSGGHVTLDPRINLDPYTGYYITLSNGAITDTVGLPYPGFSSPWDDSFITGDLVPPSYGGGGGGSVIYGAIGLNPFGTPTAPSLTAISPVDNATGVPIGSNIVLTFDQIVKAGTGALEIHNSADGSLFESISLSDQSQVSFSFNTVTINPLADLTLNSGYYVVLQDGAIQSGAGIAYAGFSSPLAFNFTTSPGPDTTPLNLVGASLNGATDVSTQFLPGLAFDKDIQPGTGAIEIHTADGSLFDSIDITDSAHAHFNENSVLLVPHASLDDNQIYYVTVAAGAIKDMAGNDFAGISSTSDYRFSTGDIQVLLSQASVAENSPNGAVVGALSTTDPDPGDTFTYSLIANPGGLFAINGTNLVIAGPLDYETATSHDVTVRATDSIGMIFDEVMTLSVTNVPGVAITGNTSANLIDATHTVSGQPLPTGEEDTINGGAGNDTIYGLGGNDSIIGGSGSDSMIGGTGNDTYVVDATGDKVLENPNEGTDTILSSVTYTLPANVEALILTGLSNINGTGNGADNTITGNASNNVLAGLGGADVLDGGAGVDTATYAASAIGVDVSLATGLGSGGDAAGDTLVNIENLTGSSFNDTLEGNDGNNVLAGGSGTDTLSYVHASAGVTISLALTSAQNTVAAGIDTVTGFENLTGSGFNDSLTGSSGSNILDGGTGADTMAGGAGNDTYIVDNVNDVVVEASGGGTDTIKTTLNAYSLALLPNVENLTFIGAGAFTGTGNALNNVLTGGAGNDSLDGGAGNDTLDGGPGADSMSGGAGNDTYVVDDAGDMVTEAAGAGTDTVKTSLAAYTLTANLENLTFTGAGNFTGTGNTLANTITGGAGNDILDGSSGNDKLLGGAGDDQLLGGVGNDSLTGGAGADTMTGGTGADRFIFTALADFASGPALDTITDFSHAQADKIDLSAIDGVAGVAGSAFTFIGAAAFSNVAGQLHYVVNGGSVNVEGDTNGDGVPDFTFTVAGVASLASTDFVL